MASLKTFYRGKEPNRSVAQFFDRMPWYFLVGFRWSVGRLKGRSDVRQSVALPPHHPLPPTPERAHHQPKTQMVPNLATLLPSPPRTQAIGSEKSAAKPKKDHPKNNTESQTFEAWTVKVLPYSPPSPSTTSPTIPSTISSTLCNTKIPISILFEWEYVPFK